MRIEPNDREGLQPSAPETSPSGATAAPGTEEPGSTTGPAAPDAPRPDDEDAAVTRAHRYLRGNLALGLVPGIELGGIQVTAWREAGSLHVDVLLEDADGTKWNLDAGYLDVCITVAGLTVHQDTHELPDACTECGASTADGEGYAGKCGNCADRAYAAKEARQAASRRPAVAVQDGDPTFTRAEVAAAFTRAVAEAERIAGDDDAIGLITGLAAGRPVGPGPFTREQVTAAWSAAADAAKAGYNPGGIENGDTIRSDSCGDLIVNLATGFLDSPGRATDDVISDMWATLKPASLEGFEVWAHHSNDLGDHCPWSGRRATPGNREALMSGLDPDDERCPQGCEGSELEDPPEGSAPYKAAIVAAVKSWVA